MKGVIFDVKRYSIHDGPGIRVTFFLKGCPLSCWWCHNPEGISPEITTVDQTDRIGEMEFARTETVGKEYDISEIISILRKESIFIDISKGGVTFSGGEPMMQIDFLLEALKACKENGFHTAVDTSGYTQPERIIKIIPFADLFLFDLKHLDPVKHMELTGGLNKLIIDNYRLIANCGSDFMVRIPVVPGINDDADHLVTLKEFLLNENHRNLKKISLLPFHRIGSSKYKRFKMPYRMEHTEQPSAQRMRELKEFFEDTGIKVKIGG